MYPTIEQYKDAIRIAEHSLATLNDYEPVLKADGEPWFSSGNFAVVFQLKHKQNGKRLALKCFTRHQERREQSYLLISQTLQAVQSDYLLQYQYLDNEIWVSDHNGDGAEYPVVAMEWTEGMTLGDYVKQHCNAQNSTVLQTLAHNFEVFCTWLIAQPFAHGDLKPDNIMVRPNGSLVLVDYDGMFVPTMQGQQAREFGSPIYRHPKRTLDTYDRYIDDFSLLVLLSELRLVAADPSLYNSSLSGESIIAKASDWQNPNESRLLQAMQTQAINGGDLVWVTWAAMLRITAQSEAYKVVDWAMVVDDSKKNLAVDFAGLQALIPDIKGHEREYKRILESEVIQFDKLTPYWQDVIDSLGVEPQCGLTSWRPEFSGQKLAELIRPPGKKPRFLMEDGNIAPASFILGAAIRAGLPLEDCLFDRITRSNYSEIIAS